MFGPKRELLFSGIICLPVEKEIIVHGMQPVQCWLETNGYPINGSMNVDRNFEDHAPCQNWNDELSLLLYSNVSDPHNGK